MSGVFKDYNLFIIQAESLMNFGIIEELTPNLYWLKTQGIELEGFNMTQQAIGNLINIVDNAGKLDNTVFMIFGDYKSKGIDLSN